MPNNTTISIQHGITNMDMVVGMGGNAYRSNDGGQFPLPYLSGSIEGSINISANRTVLFVGTGSDRRDMVGWVTLFYTKSS